MPLSNHTTTICSTARLVRGVNLQHQQRQIAAGIQQWHAAEVTTLQLWLDRLIGHATLLGLIPSDELPSLTLSQVAETYLWEQAIESCLAKHEAAALFDIRALAKSAIEANNLMLNWQLNEADINQHFMSQETRQFLRWRHTFDALCSKQQALEPTRLMALQITLIEKYQLDISLHIALPKQMLLAGFDRVTPLENRLFTQLRSCGVALEILVTNAANKVQVEYFSLSDSHAECRAAVAWAKQKLLKNPQAQLAIISPVLGNVRRELADLLDDTFHPETLLPSQYENPRCYDFSLGLALTEYPVVHSALQLLRLASSKAKMIFEEVTPILQDVYWGSASEMDARARLDAFLRQKLNASYGIETLINQAGKLPVEGASLAVLIQHLTMISQFQQQSQQRLAPSLWVESFNTLLDSICWAKSRDISSHEYQAQQSFYERLQELASLDNILGKITASVAVQKVIELCSAAMFQAESKGDVHIQILGLLETPAVQLDAIWAMNMNDQHWPPPVKLNPLLPAELQRNNGTPNASAGVQSIFAALVHQRLMVSAPEIVFSYALKEDERELRPSPLLSNNPSESASKPPVAIQTLAEKLAQPAAMQMLDDYIAPALGVDESMRGGVNLFATQAICPAWAFYQYRLGANKLETPIDGLDNMSRGSLLHKVLQLFWQDCQTLSNLKAMSDEQRVLAIDSAIAKSMLELRHEISVHLPPQVMQIERHRLQQLLQFWLDLELERTDFKIHACEEKHSIDVEGLPVNFTIDRIDALADGGLVVIDYKTSAVVANKSWADDRIAEPQLPIYVSLALKYEQVVAVCFAKVRTDESKFIGLSVDEGVLPDVTALHMVKNNSAFIRFADWDSLLEHWYTSLTSIAHEIKSGVASTTFNNEADLIYCDVRPLLRLPERMMQFEKMQAAMSAGKKP
ncbi:MAG: PD-(D/E)XK nuclease family protein [Betaproteobacteria bacterium]